MDQAPRQQIDSENTLSDRKLRAFNGFVTALMQYFVVMVLQFVLAPVILKYSGTEILGAYSFIMQIIAWGAITDMGMGVATGRSLAQAHGNSDRTKFCEIFAICRTFLLISNLLFASLVFFAAWKLDLLLKSIPEVHYQGQIALIIFGVWILIRASLSVYGDALAATQHLSNLYINATLAAVIRLLSSLMLVAYGLGLIGLIVGNILGELTGLVLNKVKYNRLFPYDKLDWGIKDRALFFDLLKFGMTYLAINIAAKISYNTDSIIIGSIIGANAVAVFYTSQMPATTLCQFIFKITENSVPAINELYARRHDAALGESYLSILRISLMLAISLSLGIFFLNKFAVSLWVGSDLFAGYFFSATLACLVIVRVLNHLNGNFLVVFGTIRLMSIWTVIGAFIKVSIGIYLTKKIGVTGVIISSLFTDLIFLIYFMNKVNGLTRVTSKQLLLKSIIPAIKGNVIPGLFVITMVSLMAPNTWILLTVTCLLYTVIFSISAWAWGFDEADRHQIHRVFSRLCNCGSS